MISDYQTIVVKGTAGLVTLAPEWLACADRAPVTASYDWVLTAASYATHALDIQTICVRSDDRLVAALPLALRRSHGTLRWVLLGSDDHFEPNDILCLEPQAAGALADAIAVSDRPTCLPRIPVGGPLYEAIVVRASDAWHVQEARAQDAPFLELGPAWGDPYTALSPRRRSDLRRMQRRAEDFGVVEFHVLRPEPPDLDGLLAKAFEVEARSWKGAMGTAMTHDSYRGGFTKSLAHSACQNGTLRLGMMEVDGELAAMQIALVTGQAFWLIKIGYDPRFARCSPGHLLMSHSISVAAQQGVRRFEFMGIPEVWLDAWKPQLRHNSDICTYPRSAKGRPALAADRAWSAAARTRQFVRSRGWKQER